MEAVTGLEKDYRSDKMNEQLEAVEGGMIK
jgi:hypothetical protein